MKENPTMKDSERFFSTDHVKADLRSHSIRGGMITLVAQSSKFILNLGATVFLARILTPEDYGLIAMVTAITGFLSMFKDFGLSMATVQREEIHHKQISTLFWINVVISIALMALILLLAPALTLFYHEPRLMKITIVLAGAFLFGGLSIQHNALLQRQMRFAAVAAVEIASLMIGIVAALLSAFYGAGYWALVIMQISIAFSMFLGFWIACPWKPGLPSRHSGVRSMVVFGSNLTGFNVINYFARNLDNMLIGWYWGANPLGFYSKAYQLFLLPLTQINAPVSSVVIPGLSRLQFDPMRFRSYYVKALSGILSLTMPVTMLVIVLAEEIVRFVLGTQWTSSIPILRLLAISALVQPVCNTAGWLYVSTDRTSTMFRWGIFASALVILSFFVGLPFGPTGVALSYSLSILILAWPCMHFAIRGTSITMADLIQSAKISSLSAIISGAACFFFKRLLVPHLPLFLSAVICSVLLFSIYFLILIYLFDGKALYLSVLQEVRRSNVPSQPPK